MSHVVESAASRRRRRNTRTAIILVVLVALLAGAFYYAATYFNKPSSSAASGCPTGAATGAAAAQPALSPGQITVNVYNATSRAGLAASVAKDIKSRGYVIGQVANDPLKKKISGVGELRYGPNGQAGANLVINLVQGINAYRDEKRTDSTVDMVVGDGYKTLAPEATPTAAAQSGDC